MRKAYQILAGLVALEVMLQALFLAWGIFGLSNWIDEDGGVLDKAAVDDAENSLNFAGSGAYGLHFLNGFMIIPLIVLLLLVVSFFAKVPRGIALAVTLVVLVILQVIVLPGLARDVNPFFGGLHGLNALLILGAAVAASRAAAGSPESVPAVEVDA